MLVNRVKPNKTKLTQDQPEETKTTQETKDPQTSQDTLAPP